MLGKDYSDIIEVKSINYEKEVGLFICDITAFVSALESVGKPIFKIRTSRFPVCEYDIKDAWMDLKRSGWHITKTWDTSMSGFNEIYLCEKLG